MPRQHQLHQRHRPSLQRLRQQRVIGEAHNRLRDLPGLVPRHLVLIEQNPHHLRHRQRRMRVVELHRDLLGKIVEGLVVLAVGTHNIAHGAGDQEVFLHQAQLLAGLHRIGGIKHFGDAFRGDFVGHGLQIITLVENLHVKFGGGARGEQPQVVDGFAVVADDRHVVRHADDELPIQPDGLRLAVRAGFLDHLAINRNQAGAIVAFDQPGRGFARPTVGLLTLVAVDDFLLEQAELIVDAVPKARHVERRHRIEQARRQPPQAAVPQRRVALRVANRLQIDLHLGCGLAGPMINPQIVKIVAQQLPHQKFHRQVKHAFDLQFLIALLGGHHPVDHALAHRQRHRHEDVVGGRFFPLQGHGILHVIAHRGTQGLHQASAFSIGIIVGLRGPRFRL